MSKPAIYLLALMVALIINFLFVKFWKFDVLRSPSNPDRWKPRRVPMTGGISIFFLFLVFFALDYAETLRDSKIFMVFIAGFCIFFLGLIDDLIGIKSYHKFLIQILVVLLVVGSGIRISMFGKPLSYMLTFLWILGLTNAFNLLDNMDGLASGIGAIAFFFLGINFYGEGSMLFAFICFLFVSLILGFLAFNFRPAKLYLGDNGSLTIGYFLSILTVLGSQRGGRSVYIAIIFPIMIMSIPIMDTLLVSVTRKLRGQSLFQGGKDHLSHRLVMLGLSETQAVLLLYLVSILLGISALFFRGISTIFSLVLYFFVSLGLVLFGIYIGKIKIVEKPAKKKNFVFISTNFLYKKRILHILVDLVLMALIYYVAYLIRFEGYIGRQNLDLFLNSVPFIIFFKIVCFYTLGIYKIESRFFSFSDGLKLLKGISLGSASSVVFLTLLNRFASYSRAVFIIDWMLTLVVIGGVKVFYRFFEELFAPVRQKNKMLIVLVGDDRMCRSVDEFLRLRASFGFVVSKTFSLTDFKFGDMIGYLEKPGSDITMIVTENQNIFSREQKRRIHELRIPVVNERVFFMKVLNRVDGKSGQPE